MSVPRSARKSLGDKYDDYKHDIVGKSINSSDVITTTCAGGLSPWLARRSFLRVLIDESTQTTGSNLGALPCPHFLFHLSHVFISRAHVSYSPCTEVQTSCPHWRPNAIAPHCTISRGPRGLFPSIFFFMIPINLISLFPAWPEIHPLQQTQQISRGLWRRLSAPRHSVSHAPRALSLSLEILLRGQAY